MSKQHPSYQALGFDDRKLRIYLIPAIGFLLPVVFDEVYPTNGIVEYGISVFVSLIYTGIFWTIDRWIIIKGHERYPNYEDYSKRIIWSVTIIFLVTLAVSLLSALVIYPQLGIGLHQDHFGMYLTPSLVVTTCVLLLYENRFNRKRFEDAQRATMELRESNLLNELTILRNQVNPHFLFNSLNTLSHIVDDQPEKAKSFIHHLSKIYRKQLEQQDDVVSLESELDLLQSYEYLLNMRFEHKFVLKIKPMPSNIHVVGRSLQLLLENSVKHNEVSTKNPLRIELYFDRNHIWFQNSLQPRISKAASTGTGLSNIKDRYGLFTDSPVMVEQTDKFFRVGLPNLAKS